LQQAGGSSVEALRDCTSWTAGSYLRLGLSGSALDTTPRFVLTVPSFDLNASTSFIVVFAPPPNTDLTCADTTSGIPGIQNNAGTVCCSPTCIDEDGEPQCGGPGCGALEGGAAGCCIGNILAAGDNTCDDDVSDAPCVLDLCECP